MLAQQFYDSDKKKKKNSDQNKEKMLWRTLVFFNFDGPPISLFLS